MSHTFIARMKVFPDKETQFIEVCERMEKAVADNEPDTLIYKFYRLREPNAFAVIESFADEAGDETHQASEHFQAIVPAMMECIDGTYTREFLDPLK